MLDHVKGGESRFKMWLKRFQVETTDTTNHYVLYIIIIYIYMWVQPLSQKVPTSVSRWFAKKSSVGSHPILGMNHADA
jgi:hypothetical protein